MLKKNLFFIVTGLTMTLSFSSAQAYFCPDPASEVAGILKSRPKVGSVIRTKDGLQRTVLMAPKYDPDPGKNVLQSIHFDRSATCKYFVTYTHERGVTHYFQVTN